MENFREFVYTFSDILIILMEYFCAGTIREIIFSRIANSQKIKTIIFLSLCRVTIHKKIVEKTNFWHSQN